MKTRSNAKRRQRPSTDRTEPVYFGISKVARMLNVSPSTLRKWESLGIVEPARTVSGYRRYTEQQLERMKEIQRVKSEKQISSAAVIHFLDEIDESAFAAKPGQEEDGTPSVSHQLIRLRERRGLSITEAAAKAGVSAGYLTSVERGRVSVSVATLIKLAKIYGTNVLSLFSEPSLARKLVRPHERSRLSTEPGITIESLVLSQSTMEPHLFHIQPKASSRGSYTQEGEEFLYVIHGVLDIWLDDEEHFRIESGDSLYFPSRQPHRWVNSGNSEAIVLWVNKPAKF